ncbi:hypothetical protein [Amycolatopsis pittospori]|uniref:hypothetical protein n=1 Tax=Amycolatopsis pittospori TaxID=2749434 RepID=UPI0015F074B7|nr:hypothetical protein [Amycolatopsis pittospori]
MPKTDSGRRADLTHEEVARTRGWLGKRGIEVGEPSRLIAVRVGPRLSRSVPGRFRWLAGAVAVSLLLSVGIGFFVLRGDQLPVSITIYVICASLQVALWLSCSHRERTLEPLPVMDRRSGRPPVFKALDAWFVASTVITFGGGAALATAMYLTTSEKAYARGWLIGLGWAALCCTVILVGTLRRPVYAQDTASATIDTELRALDIQTAVPGFYPLVVLLDLSFGGRPDAGFAGWLIAYAVLGLGTMMIGTWRQRRRPALPPGDYGTPVRPLIAH